jgi:hypothetical protein
LLAEVSHAAWYAAPLEINDGTPLGVRVQEAFMAAVLIGPTTKTFTILTSRSMKLDKQRKYLLKNVNRGIQVEEGHINVLVGPVL